MVLRYIRYSKLEISRRCQRCVILAERNNCFGDANDVRLRSFGKQRMKRSRMIRSNYRCCGKPYRAPTPTRGKKLTTFFTIERSLKANITLATMQKNFARFDYRTVSLILLLETKISNAFSCRRYFLEKIARISLKCHLPCRLST